MRICVALTETILVPDLTATYLVYLIPRHFLRLIEHRTHTSTLNLIPHFSSLSFALKKKEPPLHCGYHVGAI